jgi:prepilin-type N-terminal cleavage/methylation domain-containing protein
VSRARASRGEGFTLIELLVALTLFAVLSVLLFGALRFGMRAR